MGWITLRELTQDELDQLDADVSDHINATNPHNTDADKIGSASDSEFSSHTSSSSSHHSRYSDSEARNAVTLSDVIEKDSNKKVTNWFDTQ